MIEFKNKILIIGFGSVGKCTLPILLKHIRVPYKNITIVDFVDKRKELALWIRKGLRFSQERITPVNVARTLSKHVSPGGLVIDVAWNIDSLDMMSWCHDNKVLYLNTSVEEWDPYANIEKKTPLEKSLYYKQMELRKMTSKWSHDATTAVLDHGANPGLISHFTKQGLLDIAEKALHDKSTHKRDVRALERLVREEKFHRLAMKLGVKTIHISERDTQITNSPKEVDEFVGTWSIEGLREEATSPVEMGWGHPREGASRSRDRAVLRPPEPDLPVADGHEHLGPFLGTELRDRRDGDPPRGSFQHFRKTHGLEIRPPDLPADGPLCLHAVQRNAHLDP